MNVVTTAAGATEPLPQPIEPTIGLIYTSREGRIEPLKHDGKAFEVPLTAEAGTIATAEDSNTPLLELRVLSRYSSVADFRIRYPDTELSDEAIEALLRRAAASIDAFCGILRAVWRTETHAYHASQRVYPRRNPIQEVSALAFGHPGLQRAAPWPYTDYDEYHAFPASAAFIVRDLRYVEIAYASRYRFYELAFDPYLLRDVRPSSKVQVRITYLGGYLPTDLPYEIESIALDVAGGIARADATPPELVGVSSIHQGSQSYSLDPATRYGGVGPAGITPAIAATLQQYRNGAATMGRLA